MGVGWGWWGWGWGEVEVECVKAELCKETRLVLSVGCVRIPPLIMKGISTGRYIFVGEGGQV